MLVALNYMIQTLTFQVFRDSFLFISGSTFTNFASDLFEKCFFFLSKFGTIERFTKWILRQIIKNMRFLCPQ